MASAANAEELCARSFAERAGDAEAGLRYAELAVALARRSGLDQVRGRALAYLGNARRLVGRYADAGVALREADALLGNDLSFRHRLLGFLASYCESVRDWQSARRYLDERFKISASTPELATTLVKKAIVELHDRSPEVALKHGVAAVRALQSERPANAELLRSAIQVTANVLLELGESADSLGLFMAYDHLWKAAPQTDRLKARWLQARLLFAHGAHPGALMDMRQVRDSYGAMGRRLEAAWSAIDLAMMHTSAGDRKAARTCADEALALFKTLGLRVDAMAARLLLDAIEAGDGKDPRFREVVDLLHSSEATPA